jgi:hypothetical protein
MSAKAKPSATPTWIVVHTNGKVEAAELAKTLKTLKGIDTVEIEADSAEFVLEDIGARLWQLEDINALDCPLREMRDRIEKILGRDVAVGAKDFSQILTPVGT